MDSLFLHIQIAVETLSFRHCCLIPNIEASLKSFSTLEQAHVLQQKCPYSNKGSESIQKAISKASCTAQQHRISYMIVLHKIRPQPSNAHMDSGFPTYVNAFRYFYYEIHLKDFNNSFKTLVEIFWFSIDFDLPSDYNWPQNPQQLYTLLQHC